MLLKPKDYKLLQEEIKRLKREKNAVILAHYYQRPEIQEIADFVGDSLDLARKATEVSADIILFCGVHFMGETAKILNPDKRVLLPEPKAGCAMADMATKEAVLKLKDMYPNAWVVSYVNTTAEVKTISDVCCTSANAVKIVEKVPTDEIIFVPDKGLAYHLSKKVRGKKIIPFEGFCPDHYLFTADMLQRLKEKYPDAPVGVHPETPPEIQDRADFVGSTSQLLRWATSTELKADRVIIITEIGLQYPLQKRNPYRGYIFPTPDEGVGYLFCSQMKIITLEKVYESLKEEKNEVDLPEEVIEKANLSIKRMLDWS
ncbi:MAG TPA: quinolinate synthase NadA [Aquifex aeolicus]|uniref:Quinolinate synthase n=1 Tax=Aquifex aeolicus TaxID=63363 RepID=A0A9D0YP58_AQUAO|nr:quinolinate synthase NadA [Aquificales bacterium]HIP86379.1 quinolinate synthase NadA [Aquifex sp.]HIP98101.1 quinolinate synthase NadA [Aquifex aeolicus]HIQ26267.1 quinolinate synthase NadA [Aquifex aeolicus]